MNKGQGFAVGAIIAAGMLLRPLGSFAPQQDESSKSAMSALGSSSSMGDQGEGPWIASCNYWSPTRQPADQSPNTSPDVDVAVDAKTSKINLHVPLNQTTKEQELGCSSEPGNRWGFPPNSGQINVTAIIATVPDPVHTHLALTFDRAVDAILQAAADNHYVSSYYWLPWKGRLPALKAAEAEGNREPSQDPGRERKPGLIILKYVPQVTQADSSDNFYKVIYLFLVAETPTQGVDGFQFQNAFSYEAELESALGGHGNQFARGRNGRIAIIGPLYSGSATSLNAGIKSVRSNDPKLLKTEFQVTGATSTKLPAQQLTSAESPQSTYLSFGDNRDYDTKAFLAQLYPTSGYSLRRVALLIEENTALGNVIASNPQYTQVRVIRFPREISLLRNAQIDSDQSGNGALPSASIPSPYLRFSLKDYSAQDSVIQFSTENTPLSQEAQLMSIARQLHRFRSQFIAIVASNVLDQIFLAQFLHRACPDARLVFFGSDLLIVREIDNVPFIGSITITPYPLISLQRAIGDNSSRSFPNSSGLAYYNAVSYALWDKTDWALTSVNAKQPLLQGYRSPLQLKNLLQPSLWATALGSDGYYPLAVVSPCASDDVQILPAIDSDGKPHKESCDPVPALSNMRGFDVYPSRLWFVCCTLVFLLCFWHTVILVAGDYWSPFTRDLAVRDNDQPRRRSMYVHVATAMLFSMAFSTSFPVIALFRVVDISFPSELISMATLGIGLSAVIVTFLKTWGYIGWVSPSAGTPRSSRGVQHIYNRIRANIYLLFNLTAWVTLVGLPLFWGFCCLTQSAGGHSDKSLHLVGLSFSFRCINPGSGLSPVVPVLLLLFSWYLWAFFQTWRLRFSENGRPWLPRRLEDEVVSRFFVSDNDLSGCKGPRDSCLYDNITCLLITRAVLCRFRRFHHRGTMPPPNGQALPPAADDRRDQDNTVAIDITLVIVYATLLVWFSFFTPIRSLDHFLWSTGPYRSSPYEFLVGVLFFPLIVMSLTGWLRMILIWGAIRRGLLERLENLPIRFAFSRLKATGWMTMLRQAGLHEQWRDMARCVESMGQMLHQPDFKGSMSQSDWVTLETVNTNLLKEIRQLRSRIARPVGQPGPGEHDYDLMKNIELTFAAFSQGLLSFILIPYWTRERTGLVDSEEAEEVPIKVRRSQSHLEHPFLPMELHAGPTSADPPRILVAEEFLAIRYMSLIRAVLANMRYLMIFVSASFVLAIMAWNSYPFQPRQQVDWLFTGLLVCLGSGVIWVFAQMHRNPILSRITDTNADELGWDFYLRVVSFGVFPVLAWVAYQFPEFGSVFFKFLQPAVPVIR